MDDAIITMSGARAAYVGPALGLAPHRNAVATIAIARAAPFELNGARRITAIIPPGERHYLRAAGPMAFVYLDALSDDIERLRLTDLELRVQRWRRSAAAFDVDAICAALGVPTKPVRDAAIAAVARRIDADPSAFAGVAEAAEAAGLSPSHFQARFRRAVGLAFRRYRLWRRMAAAVRTASEGANLTEAAHAAGFASSAHFSAAFKDMFGIMPSALSVMTVQTSAAPLATGDAFL